MGTNKKNEVKTMDFDSLDIKRDIEKEMSNNYKCNVNTTMLVQLRELANAHHIKLSTAINTGVIAEIERWRSKLDNIPKLQKKLTEAYEEIEHLKQKIKVLADNE